MHGIFPCYRYMFWRTMNPLSCSRSTESLVAGNLLFFFSLFLPHCCQTNDNNQTVVFMNSYRVVLYTGASISKPFKYTQNMYEYSHVNKFNLVKFKYMFIVFMTTLIIFKSRFSNDDIDTLTYIFLMYSNIFSHVVFSTLSI